MPTLFFIHHHLHSPAYTSRLKSRHLSLLINALEGSNTGLKYLPDAL
jgi:hypothetical protein